MRLKKPSHSRYVFKNLNESLYQEYALQYSRAKRYGIRGVYSWASGKGIYDVVIEICKGTIKGAVIDYTKKKAAGLCLILCGHVGTPALVILTNSSKIVNISRAVHSTTSFALECLEDSSNLTLLPLDYVLFGQPIPVGDPNRFNLFDNNGFLNI